MGISILLLLITVPEPATASVVLRWKPVESAVRYDLEIASDAEFHSVKLTTRVDGTGFRWSELPERTHYFRVRSVDAEGRLGPYSEVKEIAPVWVPPSLNRPKPGTQILDRNTVVTFDFIPSLLFTSYRLEVASDAAFSAVFFDQTFETPPLQVPVRSAGPVYYRLRAQNAAGRTAGPSEPEQILFLPDTPEPRVDDGLLVQPGKSVELRWLPSYGASSYRVQASTDARFKTLVLDQRTTDKRYEWTPRQAGDLYWRVAAEDAAGRRSTPSLGRKVVVLEAPGSSSRQQGERVLDLDAGPLIGVYGGVLQSLHASAAVQSGITLGARIGAGVGDALLVLSLGFIPLNQTTLMLSTVPFAQYDFHIFDFRLRLGAGPAMNAVFVTSRTGAGSNFGLGVAALVGLGWAFGGQEIALEVRYTYAPLRASTLEVGGIFIALSVWYGGS